MVLSLNQNFREALEQAQSEPVIVADFDLGGVTLGTYRIHNFPGRLFNNTSDDIPILSTVTPISREVDPITRKVGYSTVSLDVVDDGTIRNWSGRFSLQGARVTIRYGFNGISISDYLVAFVGVIHEIIPDAGFITINLSDLLGSIAQRPFGGLFVGKHPVEVIKQILTHSSDLIESSDFNSTDFTASNYSSTISHFNMTSINPMIDSRIFTIFPEGTGGEQASGDFSRVPSNVPSHKNKLVPVGPIVDEICQTLQATVLIAETGEIRFKLFDASTASSRTLTTDDFDGVTQSEAFSRTINKIDIDVKNSSFGFVYSAKDATSISAIGNYEHKFAANLSAPVSHTTPTPLLDNSSTVLQVDSGMMTGFTGLRGTVVHRSSFTPATNASLSGARSATILAAQGYRGLVATFTTTTAATVNFNDTLAFLNQNDDGTVVGGLPVDASTAVTKTINSATFTGGTTTGDVITGVALDDGEALDINMIDATQIKRYTEIILNRFSRGAIVLDVRVSLRHIDLELGDLVELSTDIPLLNGADFASSTPTAKFEITKKEIDFTSDFPSVSLRLVQASLSTFSPGTVSIDTDLGFNQFAQGLFTPHLRPSVSLNGIFDGMEVSSPSGLDILIDSGVGVNGAGNQIGTSNFHTTVPASSDSYIRFNSESGTFHVDSVANGADEPASPGMTSTTLAKVVSGASSVSSVVDLRSFGVVGPLQTFRGVRAGGDALTNGSFEAWSYGPAKAPDTWSMGGAGVWGTDAIRHSANVLDGQYSIKIPSSSSVVGVELVTDLIPVKPNDVFSVTGGFKAASASGVRGSIIVEYFDTSRASLSSETVQVTPLSTSFGQIGGVISPPANSAFLQVKISRTTTGTDVFIDDVRLETGSPMFAAKVSSDITISSATTARVVFDTELADRGSWYNNSSGKATAPVSGDYHFSSVVPFFKTSGTGDQLTVDLQVNGSSLLTFDAIDTTGHTSSTDAQKAVLDVIIPLEVGDIVTVDINDTSGGSFKGNSKIRAVGATFSGKLLK